MVFYHNNAKTELNDKIGSDGKPVGVAQNVTARVQMPGRLDAGATGTITGFIDASNAKPKSVWDNATAKTSSAVALRIVPGSAKIASSNGAVNGAKLPDSLFTTGTPLGYDALNGVLPGCNKYSGYITYQFTVDKPDFTLEKQVSVDGGKTWVKSAKTTPGSTIQYRLIYTNTGTVRQDNVVLKDELPAGVSYVPGSSFIANSTTNGSYKSTIDGITSAGGYKIGSYAPKGNAYFKFSAKVPANDKLAKCGDNTLTNKGMAYTENGSKSSTADVTVTKDCTPPSKPGVSIEKTVNGVEHTKVNVNQRFNYELVVKNTGNTTLTNVKVTDKAPAHVQFVSADKGTIANNAYSYTIPTLKVGQSVKLTITAKVTDYVEGSIKNTACVDAPAVPGSPDDCDDATVEVPPKPPVPGDITVCDLTTKEIITIKETAFDANKHSKDLSKCADTPVTPPELPHTGMSDSIFAFLGLGSLVASVTYYVISRRALGNL
jgi:uncharacterized repeat protein (TIGR01451 family)/LPXTG-motif cell wall-anchored protein